MQMTDDRISLLTEEENDMQDATDYENVVYDLNSEQYITLDKTLWLRHIIADYLEAVTVAEEISQNTVIHLHTVLSILRALIDEGKISSLKLDGETLVKFY